MKGLLTFLVDFTAGKLLLLVSIVVVLLFTIISTDWSCTIGEWVIVYLLVDDIYGFTQVKKKGKRMIRRHWRRFFSQSRKYLTRKESRQ